MNRFTRTKNILFTTVAILCLGLLASPDTVSANAADLDNDFDFDGRVTTDIAGVDDEGYGLAIQSDGKIVVAGDTFSDFCLTRYNPDGSLDSNFGSGGIVTTDFAGNVDGAYDVAIQFGGKIVAVGFSNTDFAIVRYNPDGSLDTGFGSGGKVSTDFAGGIDTASGVVVQPDGKIVVAGFSSNGAYDFAVARYNPDGSLDSNFGSGGIVTTDFAGDDDLAVDVAIQPDGQIVVVGYTDNPTTDEDFALVRYNPDGSLDSSFSLDGKVQTDFGWLRDDYAYGVVLQPDGKIVVAGGSRDAVYNEDFAVARYNPDGSLDSSFSLNGKVTTDFAGDRDEAFAVALQPDGKIVAAGTAYVGGTFFGLARYNSDGSLDLTFGHDGLVVTDFGGAYSDVAFDMALQQDGKIVAAGYSDFPNSDFAVARYIGDPVAPPCPGCLFYDDFQDGILATDWTYVKPQWSETAGNLIGLPTGRKAETLASPAFTGCSLCSVKATMTTAGGVGNTVWLLAWYTDKKNTVEVLMKEESDKWILKQRSAGSVVAKLSAASSILPNAIYNVEVTYDGTNLTLIVDGVTLGIIRAATTPSGTVGFRAKNTTGYFGTIQVQ